MNETQQLSATKFEYYNHPIWQYCFTFYSTVSKEYKIGRRDQIPLEIVEDFQTKYGKLPWEK